MRTYLIVAIGGAIGTVFRAFLSSTLPSLTGTALPWPTIIINIVGSFVIGYVAMLTAADSRFAASPELRAFILVGVCGGFTTFSSFSQQTVDLIRDGRPLSALLNIGLSVAICLLSTTAGYTAATTIRGSRLAALDRPDTTLLALHDPDKAPATLELARHVMERRGGPIKVLAIDGPVLNDVEPYDLMFSPRRRAALLATRSAWHGPMAQTLNDWIGSIRREGHPAIWLDVRGDGIAAVREHARISGLAIFEHADLQQSAAQDRLRVALHHAGRPILLLPAQIGKTLGEHTAIAVRTNADLANLLNASASLRPQGAPVFALHIGQHSFEIDDANITPIVQPADRRHSHLVSQLLAMASARNADLLALIAPREREHFDDLLQHALPGADLPILIVPPTAMVNA